MQTLGAKPGFFSTLVPVVVRLLDGAYPELRTKVSFIQSILKEEEQSFVLLLERGIKYFDEQIVVMTKQGQTRVSGNVAFFMYDTLGFPLDLTQIMAAEKGFTVDISGFQEAMTAQKERGRQAGREKRLAGRANISLGVEQIAYLQKTLKLPVTNDIMKYQWDISLTSVILALVTDKGEVVDSLPSQIETSTIGILFRESPFYAESGGQISDTGKIVVTKDDGSKIELEVIDVQVFYKLLPL
jgi:alanyl-tRNA synthetase